MLFFYFPEIRSQDLVNEDYYSFEDTSSLGTEAPTNNGSVVVQNSTTDALKWESTSETAINMVENDVGSGEGDINHADKATGDLSTERYVLLEHAVEDLPSAEEIFKTFEGETTEATTTTSINDLETTKDQHIKQIFEKLGVTKDMVTDLFGATVTESMLDSIKRSESFVSEEVKEDTDDKLANNSELDGEFLLNARVNGNLYLTNLESSVLVENKEKTQNSETKTEATSSSFDIKKELEKEILNVISDKSEENLNKSFDSSNENKDNVELNENKKSVPKIEVARESTTQENNQHKEELVTSVSTNIIDESFKVTPKSEVGEDTSLRSFFSSVEANYENFYGSRFEENYTHRTKSEDSATVDPALYEYEAHSNEDDIILSTTTEILKNINKSVIGTNEIDLDDNQRQNKGLDLEKQDSISDKLDFDSSTTLKALTFEIFTEEITEKLLLSDKFHPVVKTDVSTETINFATSTTVNIDEQFINTIQQVTEVVDAKIPTEYFTEDFVTEPKVKYPVSESFDDVVKTSTASTTLSNDDFTTLTTKSQNSHVAFDDADIISVTTHTPTSRILTESVSLVTEHKADDEATVQQNSLFDSHVNRCIKLNFTGQLRTNVSLLFVYTQLKLKLSIFFFKETIVPIPDNANIFGTCDSNRAFVNVSWESEHRIKVILFFNFTEDLLTNVQLNLLYGKHNQIKIYFFFFL